MSTTVHAAGRRQLPPGRVILHGILFAGSIVSLFPLYWLVVMASNTTSDIYKSPPVLVPGPYLWDNIQAVFRTIDFGGSLVNTVIVAVSVTVMVLFFDSIAAFAFAKYEFPGRRALFALLLVTFMLPAQLSVIPQFVTMIHLGWVGQLQALIVPAAANAFGIFWLRQFIVSSVPDELIDAARIDGAGFFRQYLTVCLPLIRPGLGFLGIFTFIAAWNDYLWPLIVLNDPGTLTLQVAMSQLNSAHGKDYGMVMAGALLAVIPLILVFLVGAKQFIGDIAKGALK
ncbi:carbohydrate ABC transporter permease [Clavibacter sp. Sh2088]|uniref:carbohydrate ABC transporter permease n=1 Tax=Clavibacter sp. Sh2088 TaxID=3397676 RepID=UPI0039E1E61D